MIKVFIKDMYLVEKHIINNNHPYYNECDDLCFRSKNLYNRGLYEIRQYFFEYGKYLKYTQNYQKMKGEDAYKDLPTKVSCQTLKMVDQNFKSFFGILKQEGMNANIPNYLDKVDGRYIAKFPKQSIGKRYFKQTGKIKLSQTDIVINTKINDFNNIKEVRIAPRRGHYVIEVVYERIKNENNNTKVAAIDPGLNNLATVTFSSGEQPFIINGRPLKSMNQYYNKEKSRLQSEVKKKQNKRTSNEIKRLTHKRNNKINDYLHNASRSLVDQIVSHHVGQLIIGKNTGQKQDINNGKKNNQNFVSVPIFKFLFMVAYKARLEGIKVVWQEESYTSKASFINGDEIPVYGENNEEMEFSGYRMNEYRGLYKIKGEKKYINSDVNGSYNIMKKAIPNAFAEYELNSSRTHAEGIEGMGVCPVKLQV